MTSAVIESRMNLDPVVAEHLNHLCNFRRTKWDLAIQCSEHFNRIASFPGDFQHFTAAGALVERMNRTSRNMHECAR